MRTLVFVHELSIFCASLHLSCLTVVEEDADLVMV